jgi:outer membrane protein OmpA-like peptidoglycan-associated protein
MDTHLFRPAVDTKGFLVTNGSDVLPANQISFGLVLDYGRGILPTNDEREDPGADALIQDSFQGTFGLSYGLFNRAVVGVQLPVVLMSTDEGLNDIGPTGETYDIAKVNTQKFSWVALHGKVRLTRVERGPGLAVLVQGGIPVADAERDLASEPGPWVWPRLAFENRFFKQKLRIGLEGGARLAGGEGSSFGRDSRGLDQLKNGEVKYGDLATAGIAVSYRALPALDLVADLYSSYLMTGDSAEKQRHSEELIAGIKLFMDENSYLTLAAGGRTTRGGFEAADARMVIGFMFEPSIGDMDGDGIQDDRDKCPAEKEDRDGFRDEDGCPDPDNDEDGIPDTADGCPNVAEDKDGDRDRDGCPEGSVRDRDGDGILDIYDRCPKIREDMDGFEDKDGCPERDNDKDGIPDERDKCPNAAEDDDGYEDLDGCPERDNDGDQIPDSQDECPVEPETYNGHDDKDGCPDQGRVIVEGSEIVILDKVQFESNSAKILDESTDILDEVAATLKGHAEFKVVEVAGHADERGAEQHNLMLTKRRAEAVVKALASRGVARSRLVSQGYGEYCPLDKGTSNEALEKNRRVEFKVVKTDKGVTDVERGCARAKQAGVEPPPLP